MDTTHAATLDLPTGRPDMEDYGGPYAELLYAEFDSVGRYRPTVLEARSAGQADLLLKVMWSDEPGIAPLHREVPAPRPSRTFNVPTTVPWPTTTPPAWRSH